MTRFFALVLVLVMCACAQAPVGKPTTRFVLSDAPVPGGHKPFATLLDERSDTQRLHRHDGVETFYGDEWLAQPLADSLRAEVAAQVATSERADQLIAALKDANVVIRQFEFSHRPRPPGERLFAVEPTHKVTLRLVVLIDGKTVEALEVYRTGSDTPQFTMQMRPYFGALVRNLLKQVLQRQRAA